MMSRGINCHLPLLNLFYGHNWLPTPRRCNGHLYTLYTLATPFQRWIIDLDFLFDYCSRLTLYTPISKNGQTPANNSSANCWRIVWVCLTILWHCCLKGKGKKNPVQCIFQLSRMVHLLFNSSFFVWFLNS